MGPTGAGKTTILDAICLSLYGRTPRLGKITKAANELMSRHKGEIFAEVGFETAKGRFRCHWSQRRARKKHDEALQNLKHEVLNIATKRLLASGLKDTPSRVEMITGMDFQRFTRSMLLAQGGFAAFLQAQPDERAPILERVTGTDIYGRISIKVHEHKSAKHEKLDRLHSELEGLRPVSGEEEEELRNKLEEKKNLENQWEEKLKASRHALAWVDGVEKLTNEIVVFKKAWSGFEIRKKGV